MEQSGRQLNRADRRAAASAEHGGSKKYGWRINEWSAAVGCSRSSTYELIAAKIISSVKFGGARIITTHPMDFLASLPEAA